MTRCGRERHDEGKGNPSYITMLFHHNPDHSDAEMDRLLETARNMAGERGSTMDIVAASEGLELDV